MMKKRLGAIFLAGIVTASLLAGCSDTGGAQDTADSVSGQESSSVGAQIGSVNQEDVAEGLESPENPEFAKENIRGVSVVVDGEPVYQLNYTPQDDKDSYLYWDMVTPYASTAIVNTETMYELYEEIAGINLTAGTSDQQDSSQDPKTFDTYLTLNYYESEDSDEQKAEPNRTVTLLIGEKQDNQYYCVLKGYEEKALLLDSAVLDAVLQQDPYDLILKIPYVINVATVKEVDITYGGQDYQMTLEGDTYKINQKKVDSEAYLSLYSELMQPMLDGKIPEDDKLDADREPLISIRYIRNMDGARDYEIHIYPYGDGQYTVSVNGEEHFFLSAEDVEALEKTLKEAF